MLADKMRLRGGLIMAVVMGWLAVPAGAWATPHFTLTPVSGNETVGQNFDVILGVDSDTEKVVGIDIKATFDSSKLEIVGVQKGSIPAGDSYYQFDFSPSLAQYDNTTGTFAINLSPISQSIYEGPIAKQELIKITFKPKTTGVASLNYTCVTGSVTESNIIKAATAEDVVDCSANQSGSYTIASSTGGGTITTPTVVPTTASSGDLTADDGEETTTTTSSELPQTGAMENTIAMVVFGLSGMMAAVYLKKL